MVNSTGANLEGYIASNHPNTQTNNDNSDQLQNSERPIGINSQSQHATSSSHEKSPTSLVTSSTSSISSVGDNEKEASPGEGRGLKRGSDSSSSRSTHRVCEKTVAVGYWGRPQSLQGATSDFLCVQAALKGDTSPNSLACQLGKFLENHFNNLEASFFLSDRFKRQILEKKICRLNIFFVFAPKNPVSAFVQFLHLTCTIKTNTCLTSSI